MPSAVDDSIAGVQLSRRFVMRSLMHVRRNDQYFHGHPLQSAFSLIAAVVLAGLVVIALLVTTAR
jgi:hypothetical protein